MNLTSLPPLFFTCDFSLEGTATDVVWSTVFDADQVVPRGHGSVLHLVALWDLLAVHLHLGWTLDGHGQGPRTRLSVVNDELRLGACEIKTALFYSSVVWTQVITGQVTQLTGKRTCRASLQSSSVCRDQTGLAGLSRFPDAHLERASRDVSAVEFDVDGVDAVLPGDEPDGVLVCGKGTEGYGCKTPTLGPLRTPLSCRVSL